MNKKLTRRSFLRTNITLALAAGAFPTIIPGSALGREGKVAPGSRVVVGCIGNGPQGRGVMNGFLAQADAQVVAVCDVKLDQLELARTAVNQRYSNSDCATYSDFHELLARKDIDAVLIATRQYYDGVRPRYVDFLDADVVITGCGRDVDSPTLATNQIAPVVE